MYPSISIVIPSWNQGKFIERTLLSIFKQEYLGKVEVIVSDGGSTDETVDILKKYNDKITWWSAPDEGFVDAVMKGVAVAKGELLGIQSSDDYYLVDAFKNIVDGFKSNPDAAFVSGWDIQIDIENNVVSTQNHSGQITPLGCLEFFPPQHCTLLKRKMFEKVGGLRKEVDMCADIDLWYRIAHFSNGHYVNKYISAYQLHPDQRTKISQKWYSSLVNMVESCESNPVYGSIFRLTNEQKKNLYTYWKIGWTAKYSVEKAVQYANEALHDKHVYNETTKNMIYGYASQPIFPKVKLYRRLFRLMKRIVFPSRLKTKKINQIELKEYNRIQALQPLVKWLKVN